MDFLTSMKISSSALAANRTRMGAISSNIANAQTTRTPEGGPYRKKEVVFGSEPARDSFGEILEGELDEKAQAVYATEVIQLTNLRCLNMSRGTLTPIKMDMWPTLISIL